MNLDEIKDLWREDSIIDRSDLVAESLKIPQLHSKYYNIYVDEKQVLKKNEEKYKTFYRDKFWYYAGKLDVETMVKYGWKPFDIFIENKYLDKVIDGDDQIVEYQVKIARQTEKVEFLKSIIQSLNQRTFMIKNAIEMLRFENGLN